MFLLSPLLNSINFFKKKILLALNGLSHFSSCLHLLFSNVFSFYSEKFKKLIIVCLFCFACANKVASERNKSFSHTCLLRIVCCGSGLHQCLHFSDKTGEITEKVRHLDSSFTGQTDKHNKDTLIHLYALKNV